MSFEKHLFISYAHLDNQALNSAEKGWISEFHAALEAFLGMRMGTKAEIWRDERLRGNDDFSSEIISQFPKTALLVSILTPRYVSSEWCTREANEFCKIAQATGGVMIGNKARVFKVIKTPVDSEETLPLPLKGTLGYDFFTEEDGVPLELDPREDSKEYRRKINKLAWDIAEMFKKRGGGTNGDTPSTSKPVVYLAECSYDRSKEREILEGDLKRHGYVVLPDYPLPRQEKEYIDAVNLMMQRASLSIHLVGAGRGTILDGPSELSTTRLQNQLAANHSKANDFSRVIWLPLGTNASQPAQQSFIDELHQNAEAQFGADLIAGDFEELKNAIHTSLKNLEVTLQSHQSHELADPTIPENPATTTGDSKFIYMICNENDRKATIPVRKYLRENGFEVAIPAFEGDASEVREAHRQHLTDCDAVMIFYGSGDEAWKRAIDNDLKKVPGFRSGMPITAKFTYLAAPGTADKEDLIDMDEPNLINGLDTFSESTMAPFIDALSVKRVTP